MDPRFRKSLKISTAVHALVILALIVVPALLNWRWRRQRKDYVVIDLTLALPEIPASAVEAARAQKPPEPPKDIPEEPKPKPKPQIEKSTKRITRPEPKPRQPQLTPEEIRRLLAAGARISDRTSLPDGEFPFAWYYALVRQAMYEAWNQPGAGAVPAGTTAEVLIRVEKDGTITSRKLTRSSGNAVMDESVMRAVQSVAKLRPLPPQFAGGSKEITIEFQLAPGGP